MKRTRFGDIYFPNWPRALIPAVCTARLSLGNVTIWVRLILVMVKTRILIADETERGAQAYEKVIPGFKGSFGGRRESIKPPVDLVPPEMCEKQLSDVWKGWLYCIEFRKPG